MTASSVMLIVLPMSLNIVLTLLVSPALCLLYPFASETRHLQPLDGLWCFVTETANSNGYGITNRWYKINICRLKNSTRIAVPGSYNDQTQKQSIRRHVGWAWYQREFYIIELARKNTDVILRFESVNYYTMVWLNGHLLMEHIGGHLPFQTSVKQLVELNKVNTLTVAVNNSLSHDTIPSAEFQYKTDRSKYPPGFFIQTLDFDFFNYAGINRPVYLYYVPSEHVESITTSTGHGQEDRLNYSIRLKSDMMPPVQPTVLLELSDADGAIVSSAEGLSGALWIPNVHLWWPVGLSESPGYLYTLCVKLVSGNVTTDIYCTPIGIRSIQLKNRQFLINGKTFYFAGFGMHEDSEIRGRGFDPVLVVKDMHLLEWFGANSLRTSHYPYSEERLFEADRRGIVVIDELPAVGIKHFTEGNLILHQKMLYETINRDRNHASVVMWSLANEPDTKKNASMPYFKKLIQFCKALDPSRPVTTVYGPSEFFNDATASMMDVICLNRYYGWYRCPGNPELISKQLQTDLLSWSHAFQKPILMTEYGAEAVDEFSSEPAVMFSPQYQMEVFRSYHQVFDRLRNTFLIGEMVWNFADFMTNDALTRAVGNRKGVLRRNRQPKQSAYVIQQRYLKLTSMQLS